MRLVKRGPYVAARIARPFGCYWQITVNGKTSPAHADPVEAKVFDVWTWGEFVSQGEYETLLENAPRDPYQAINLSLRGLSDAMREQDELDYWMTQPIA